MNSPQEHILALIDEGLVQKALEGIKCLPENDRHDSRIVIAKADALYELKDDVAALDVYLTYVDNFPATKGIDFALFGAAMCLKNLLLQVEARDMLLRVSPGHGDVGDELAHSAKKIIIQTQAREALHGYCESQSGGWPKASVLIQPQEHQSSCGEMSDMKSQVLDLLDDGKYEGVLAAIDRLPGELLHCADMQIAKADALHYTREDMQALQGYLDCLRCCLDDPNCRSEAHFGAAFCLENMSLLEDALDLLKQVNPSRFGLVEALAQIQKKLALQKQARETLRKHGSNTVASV
jgi:hypothetical protein